MRYTALQLMKKKASENFKLGKAEFDGFKKIDVDESSLDLKNKDDLEYADDQLDIWANIRISYTGTPPESYRVLNQMIMDWVDDNEKDLKKQINPELISFIDGQYKDVDVSDLDADFDDYIWEDQVDYMPDVDEDNKEIKCAIELVLEIEYKENDDE